MNRLAQTLTLSRTTLTNRLVVPPMVAFGYMKDDAINEAILSHYRALGQGGAGLVFIESSAVYKMKEGRPIIRAYDEALLPSLRRLAEAGKSGGAACLIQLVVTGLSSLGAKTVADLPQETFKALRDAFVSAAVLCQRAGFDGVELHAAHGFYLNQVLELNSRCPFPDRLPYVTSMLRDIRALCGEDFLLCVRFGNGDPAELVAEARAFEEAGADLLSVSSGCRPWQAPADFPADEKLHMAAVVKQAVSLPVIGVGNIHSAKAAEEALEAGWCDLVASGRANLADPAFAGKLLRGETPRACFHCKNCGWFRDHALCPARKSHQNP